MSETGTQPKDDVSKVVEAIFETANALVPKMLANVAKTQEKSSFTIRCEAGYNKDDELVVKIGGTSSEPVEAVTLTGEILEGKLRIW